MQKLKRILIVIAGLLMLAVAGIVVYHSVVVDDLPGSVEGSNPRNIPESQLPVCNFTGVTFVETPCYSPPGSIDL